MREIKFRGFSVRENKFVYGDFFKKGWGYKNGISAQVGFEVWDIKDGTIGQYTGLKDKNGVQIFEGDIVSMVVFEDNAEYLGDVVFKNGCFCLNISLDGTEYKIPALEWKETETIITVIGNIYENPDLLEVRTK